MCKTVRDTPVDSMVAQWLTIHGFDGLYNDVVNETCGCRIGDLFPCNQLSCNCRPGYIGTDILWRADDG